MPAVEHAGRVDGQTAPSVLPQPPDDQEKHSYAGRRLWVLTGSSLISVGCLAVSQFRQVQSSPWLWVFLPFLVFTLLYYLTSLRVNAFTTDFDLAEHRRLVRDWHPVRYPAVGVLLPVCGEPVDVLRNTWTHVHRLTGHYRGTVTAYVLDDSGNPELAALAAEFGFVHGSRPNRGWYKKAGNLHYGLSISDEEYVLILDADFAPRADLLDELLPYLEQDPLTGIVQSPQFFRVLPRQTWIERGAGAVQELFYRAIQVSRQRRDGAICVGSCAVYRRAALQANGGTTLIEHSEDVHTGFDLNRLGWTLRYVPIPLATGICPDSVSAFFHQQYRWCSGSMSLLGSRKFWNAELRLATRLCYISGFLYYLHTALFTFLAPLIPITLLVALPGHLKVEYTLLVLPSVLYTTVIFPWWHNCPYRLEAWAARMLYGWAHVFAVWDILRGRRMSWRPTGSATAKQDASRRLWTGIRLWNGGTAVAWVGTALWRMLTLHPPDFVLILCCGLFYAAIVARVLIPGEATRPRPRRYLSATSNTLSPSLSPSLPARSVVIHRLLRPGTFSARRIRP
ncbi:glycosyltransferase [Streptomyces sp. A3M-1-3]|uniref:glycosyltransferase family 2 protein n=1 Tax=Streptomyces sp. A3M-1-3 TaxID=2962044 RepID=UPI0020B6A253|nr:glycosyltransferase family 2 protein [Streptomyces sp. A3M-1-3]MCP3819926.1 glycosyltransferase [Streptomyces sp. A3M-1-3]